MKLRQLQETVHSSKMTSKKIAALLLAISGIVWTAGFVIAGVSAKMGIEMLFIFTFFFMLAFIAFTWDDKRIPKPEHQPPKQPQPKDY